MNVERAVTPDWPTAMAQMALKLDEIRELHQRMLAAAKAAEGAQ